MSGRFRGPEMATLHLLLIADCLSYMAVHCRRLGLPCCRCSHLEQSASTRHVRILYVCFLRMLEGFSLQAFLSMTRFLNFFVVIFGHLIVLFYLPGQRLYSALNLVADLVTDPSLTFFLKNLVTDQVTDRLE